MGFEKHNSERHGQDAEKIEGAAIVYRGKLFTGPSHLNILLDLQDEYEDFENDNFAQLKEDGGFITTNGNFVDRKTAFEIAKSTGQINTEKEHGKLNTEDLIMQ